MRNLAGYQNCDEIIDWELRRAKIEAVVGKRSTSEVAATITGKIGFLTMYRAWTYWVVEGPVPLAVAQELYADPVGTTDVRVDGHCGCPEPTRDVNTFHIDSEVGLRLFADTLRKHGIGS